MLKDYNNGYKDMREILLIASGCMQCVAGSKHSDIIKEPGDYFMGMRIACIDAYIQNHECRKGK